MWKTNTENVFILTLYIRLYFTDFCYFVFLKPTYNKKLLVILKIDLIFKKS